MRYYHGYPFNGGQMLVGMLAMLALSIAVVWAVAWIVTSAMHNRDRHAPASGEIDALTILQRRYAAGEIDDAEYDRRRRILRGGT